MTELLRDKINAAPKQPGCYLFYDKFANIIYVGKSKMLANRVRSYFQESAKDDDRIWKLIREIRDVEYITTATELDALMQEYRLIKQHKPIFNSQHIRASGQLYLRIDSQTAYPTLSVAAERLDDEAEYYGTFDDQYDARDALELLNDTWNTPLCSKVSFGMNTRPCLNYDIGKCCAPCAGLIDATSYRAAVMDAARLLSGQRADAFDRLESEMRLLASQMLFEKAGAMKDRLAKLERLRRKCRHRFRITDKTNALVFMKARGESAFSAFYVHQGKVENRMDCVSLPTAQEASIFIADVAKKQSILPNAEWMPGCLMDIFAQKEFIELSPQFNAEEITKGFWNGVRAIASETSAVE